MQASSTNKGRRAESLLCVLLLCILFLFSSAPIKSVKHALLLCYTTVIPAIFPFMIVSTLILRTGAHRLIGSLLSRPMKLIFGCSEKASVAVALGYLCGFPIGALSAASLYNNGEISKNELKRLLLFVNNPSAAFVISGVGLGVFGSARVGRLLYLSVLIPSVLIGIASRSFFRDEKAPNYLAKAQKSDKSERLTLTLTRAIGESAVKMLTVCACIVFFSVPVGIINEIFADIGAHPTLCAILSSFFEVFGGCGASGGLSSPVQALMICAFACSWSGLSVHLQVSSVLEKCDVSLMPYLLSKLAQSVASPLLVFLFSRSATELVFADIPAISIPTSTTAQLVFLLTFIFSVVVMGVLYSCKRVASRKV